MTDIRVNHRELTSIVGKKLTGVQLGTDHAEGVPVVDSILAYLRDGE